MKEDLSSPFGDFSPERTLILMKTDYSKLNEKIFELAGKFGENGAFLINHKGETVLSTVYGKNLSTEEPIEKESRYLLPLECSSMLTLCAFILIDEGKLRLSDKISKFVPEFEHADKITVRHLLSGKSGLPDSDPNNGKCRFAHRVRAMCKKDRQRPHGTPSNKIPQAGTDNWTFPQWIW